MALTTTSFVCALALGVLLTVPLQGHAGALDPRLEATTRLYREAGAARALPEFEKLAREFAQGSHTHDQAAALHYVGECHWRLGNFPDAHRYLDRALKYIAAHSKVWFATGHEIIEAYRGQERRA